MNDVSYNYDVAFSFLAQDEPLATELNDLLQDRLKTFLYSKRQGEIAGTDGEQTFNSVFSEQARIVVVLYRAGWGKSTWTRIEETAIRNRAFEHGYNFVKFIPLDDPPTVPKWLPRTQLWLGFKRWGIAGTASAIEARVEECGGEAHEESVQERAARLEQSLNFNERRRRFLNSDEGVQAASKTFEKFKGELQKLLREIADTGNSIKFEIKTSGTSIVVSAMNMAFSLKWKHRSNNTLTDSELTFTVYDSLPDYHEIGRSEEEPQRLLSLTFAFDLTPTEENVWVEPKKEDKQYSTKDLASYLLKRFMDKVVK